ncbi:MAG: hypothetical protein WBW74_28370, partial [Xanthobacteraceae bacterium]
SAPGAAAQPRADGASQRLTVRPKEVPPADHFWEETSRLKRRTRNPPQGDSGVDALFKPDEELRNPQFPDVIPNEGRVELIIEEKN